MFRFFVTISALVVSYPAFAQQQQPIMSAAQRCGQVAGEFLAGNATLTEALEQTRVVLQNTSADLKKAQAKIKELEDKAEPKKEDAPKTPDDKK